MAQTEMSLKIEHLKRFLITRLLFVMVFIIISEILINYFIGHTVFPELNALFEAEVFLEEQSFETNVILIVCLVVDFICEEIEGILPGSLSFISKSLWRKNRVIKKMPGIHQILIIIVLFVVLCIYLLPYIAGVIYYSGIVIRKIEEVREYDQKQREEFDKKRNLLLSDITHDLKTPITTISGYAQALNDGMVKDEKKQKQYLYAIKQKSLEMSNLITLLFDYVKLDSAGFSLKMERVNITELVLQVSASLYTDIEDAGMEFDAEIPEDPGYAKVDKAQFKRALANLIINAIRHNDRGTRIKIRMKSEYGYWMIKVMDSGCKIDGSIMENLFDPFVTGDESRNSGGGSGLGLSVSKKVIDMHGGRLILEQPTEDGYTKAFCIYIRKAEDKEYEYDS